MSDKVYEFDSYRVEVASRRLLKNGEPIPLSSRAFDLLVELIKRNNQIISQDHLINVVWQDQAVAPNNLSQAVKQIRRALGDTGKEHRYLITVPRQGFKFVLGDENKFVSPQDKHKDETEEKNLAPTGDLSLEANEIVSAQSLPVEKPHALLSAENQKTESDKSKRKEKSFWLKAAAICLIAFVGIAAVYFWQTSRGKPALNVKSMAVLPFVNFSRQVDDEVLGLGMADTLITKLGTLRQISVQPTGSITKFNQKERDIYEIGRQLQVDAVLDGNFKREGELLHVNVQLVDTKNKTVLWSDSFTESFAEVFFIQDRIAEQIAETLKLELTNDEKRFLAQRYTDNTEAYRLYLKAREIHYSAGAEGFLQARSLYAKAIQLDKNFALAYIGLGRTFSTFQGTTSPKQAYQIMREYTLKALELDDNLSEAHSTLAMSLWRGDWNWRDAELHFKRALELPPRDKRARTQYALFLIGQTRFDEAHAVVDRELKETPDDSSMLWAKATVWHYSRQYEQAENTYLKTLEKYPNNLDSITGLVLMYIAQNRYDETQPFLAKIKAFSTVTTENTYLIPGLIYAKQGQTAKAREMITELQKLSEKRPGTLGAVALIHAALVEKDKAFEYLEKSIEEREHYGYLLKVNPLYDNLRDDRRFEKMLQKVNLAP